MMIKKNKKEEDCLASKTAVLGERTAGFSRALGKTISESVVSISKSVVSISESVVSISESLVDF